MHLASLLGLALLAGVVAQGPPATAPAGGLQGQLTGLVRQERWAEAVALAAAAVRAAPGDAAMRALAIDLNMTIARRSFAAERFTEAEAAAAAVLALEPKHVAARRIADAIAQGRAQLDARLAQADRLLKLERFDEAAAIYRQADALAPQRRGAWTARRLAALVGSADDHYLCSNFPDAFLRYEQAARLYPEGPAKTDPRFQQRWITSLILAIGQSRSPVPANLGDWERVLTAMQKVPDQQLASVLVGLIREQMDEREKAAAAYAAALNRAVAPGATLSAADYEALRSAALDAVRQRVDAAVVSRRSGPWAVSVATDWQALTLADGVTVQHFNAYAAQRVGDAVQAELVRLPRLLGLSDRQPLGGVPVTVWVHPDDRPLPGGITEPLGKGRTALTLENGKLARADVHIFASDPLSLSSTVPHELGHVLIAVQLGPRGLPAAIEEGLVVLAEPPARLVMFERMYREARGAATVPGTSGPASRPTGWVRDLLTRRGYPAGAGAFYARSAALVAFLQARKGPAALVEFARRTPSADWPARLPGWLGLADLAAVEAAMP